MPGTTSRGYPYPLGADPIDIAGDIKKLAESIDTDTVGLAQWITNVNSALTTVSNNLTALTTRVSAESSPLGSETGWSL